jgi:hypothetical protein
MIGDPVQIVSPNASMIFGLSDQYEHLSEEETNDTRQSFAHLAGVMMAIFEGVMAQPELGSLAARTLKATAEMLAEHSREGDSTDPREETA